MPNDDRRERLSTFADGALPPQASDRLLADLARDDALRGSWHRYHLIGDVLRGEAVACDVAERVREAVAQEPRIVAPRRRREFRLPGWLAPAAGLLAAASFGAMAVLLLPRGEVGTASVASVAVAPQPPRLQIVRSEPMPARSYERVGNAAVENELHRYLTVHSDYAASGLKGPLPLAPLLVGYGAGR